MTNNNLKKNFIWNAIGTTFSAFNSLFFMIIATRINGVSDAGIFTFAFSLACLFYVIGIYSGRTFQITDNDKNISDSDYFYSKILTCIIMLVSALLYCFIRNYSLYKIIIIIELVIYKLFEALSESSYAIIQKENDLHIVGKSLFFKAIFSLLLFLIIDLITKNIILSSLMIIIANLLFIILFDFRSLKKIKFKLGKINYKNIIELLKKGFFAFAFTFLTLYVINAPKYSIDHVLNNKAQTIFGIIAMPATILILFGQYIIQPFLVPLKEKLYSNKSDFIKLIIKICGVLFIFGLLCEVIIYFIGIPVLELLYGISLKKYFLHLIIIMLGATFYAVSVVFSTALTTMRNTFDQTIIFVITSIVSFILSTVFVNNYSLMGASMAYTLSMLILLILYIIEFAIKITKYKGDKYETN